jgi:hypothetical protein
MASPAVTNLNGSSRSSSHLADGEDVRVMCYVSFLLRHFNLQEWTVLLSLVPTVAEEPGERPDMAGVHTNNLRYCAVLQLGPRWAGANEDLRRETLTHEILHLMTREIRLRGTMYAMKLQGRAAGSAMCDLDDTEERLVDRLASTLAPHLPQYPGPLSTPIPTVRLETDWC